MKIKVKLCCPGMVMQMDAMTMELKDQACVEDALKECMKIPGMTPEVFDGSFLLDRSPVTRETPLTENSELMIIKVLAGG